MKNKQAFVALLVSCLAGLAHADTAAGVYAYFDGSISGWNPVDDDNDPDNGPFYPYWESPTFGYGSYNVALQWPDHTVYSYRDMEYGPPPLFEDGYGELAGINVGGGSFNASISIPDTANGSSSVFGDGWVTYTLLPGTTLTFSGYWGSSYWSLGNQGVNGTYDLTLRTWEGAYYKSPESGAETILTMAGSFSSLGADNNTYGEATFSFTNNTDVVVARSFAISGGMSMNATYEPPAVSPVPEPQTYAMMLAGLAAMGLAGRRRKRE